MHRTSELKKGKRTRGVWQASRLEGKVKNVGITKIKKPKLKRK